MTTRLRPQLVLPLLLALLVGWSLVGASPARAAEQIDEMQVAVQVNADSSMTITEHIDYQFPEGESRHGIVRQLVTADPLDTGEVWHYDVTVQSVTANGQPVPYDESVDGSYLTVRIGDPNALVSGNIAYEIRYDVTGALRSYTADELQGGEPYGAGDVELYWDLIGNGWDVPIAQASASVTGPAAPLASGCYVGAAGSETECTVREEGDALGFGPVSLDARSALTAVIAYPGSAFTAMPTPDIAVPGPLDSAATSFLIGLPLALLGLAIPLGLVLASRRRLRGAQLDGAPVQFAPPGNLRPAELQASATGEVDAAGALATLLDLVARRHISIRADDGGFLGKDSITVTWKSENPDDMAPWEQELLGSILNGQSEGSLSGYDSGFAQAVKSMSSTLVADATAAGRWSADRNPAWKRGLTLAVVLGAVIAFAGFFLGGSSGHIGVVIIALMAGISLIVGSIIALRLVPIHQTPESAQFLAEYEGFRKLLDTDAAEARRELAHRMGLEDFAVFATMLPYAVVYGLDESWTQAFPDLEPEQLHRMGYDVTTMSAMYGMLAMSRASLATASVPPSAGRSGGSGFSGGSAGGGGGGGGGGSW